MFSSKEHQEDSAEGDEELEPFPVADPSLPNCLCVTSGNVDRCDDVSYFVDFGGYLHCLVYLLFTSADFIPE